LETGSPSAGLRHVLQKQCQAAQRGVGQDQVAAYVLTAVTNGKVVGMQRTRPIHEFQWNGQVLSDYGCFPVRDAFLQRRRDPAGRLARELGPGYRV
jgi:hypothetical protein